VHVKLDVRVYLYLVEFEALSNELVKLEATLPLQLHLSSGVSFHDAFGCT
jgi:hypothetical protein